MGRTEYYYDPKANTLIPATLAVNSEGIYRSRQATAARPDAVGV
ncbi:hypothetical protein OH805_07040 [Streptomyces sp. NBC_00879]|nr:hypothetical protein OH805_07040 [Streptomyces sp. NBC_00879]